MAENTIFRIASMTKPIISAATMNLVDDGTIRLSDPITTWLPEFSDMRVLKDPEGPLDDTFRAPRLITVEDLLTHRSGLTYDFISTGPIAKAYHPLHTALFREPDEGWRRSLRYHWCTHPASASTTAIPPMCWACSSPVRPVCR